MYWNKRILIFLLNRKIQLHVQRPSENLVMLSIRYVKLYVDTIFLDLQHPPGNILKLEPLELSASSNLRPRWRPSRNELNLLQFHILFCNPLTFLCPSLTNALISSQHCRHNSQIAFLHWDASDQMEPFLISARLLLSHVSFCITLNVSSSSSFNALTALINGPGHRTQLT